MTASAADPGLMPVLPRHAVDVATFEETSMSAPVGSGPYRVSAVKPGASVTLTRNPDYWGRDLPVNRGLWNFDEIRLDFYREANGQFEAFKRGLYDFRVETEPLRWHDGYDFPAARNGEVIRDTIKTGMPQPSEFLVFNTRRPVFSDNRPPGFDAACSILNGSTAISFFAMRAASFSPALNYRSRPRADDRERALLKPTHRIYHPVFSTQLPASYQRWFRLAIAQRFARTDVVVAGRLRSRWHRVAAAFD
jgi:peptide/nickel transport system substrate-binding protein